MFPGGAHTGPVQDEEAESGSIFERNCNSWREATRLHHQVGCYDNCRATSQQRLWWGGTEDDWELQGRDQRKISGGAEVALATIMTSSMRSQPWRVLFWYDQLTDSQPAPLDLSPVLCWEFPETWYIDWLIQ